MLVSELLHEFVPIFSIKVGQWLGTACAFFVFSLFSHRTLCVFFYFAGAVWGVPTGALGVEKFTFGTWRDSSVAAK